MAGRGARGSGVRVSSVTRLSGAIVPRTSHRAVPQSNSDVAVPPTLSPSMRRSNSKIGQGPRSPVLIPIQASPRASPHPAAARTASIAPPSHHRELVTRPSFSALWPRRTRTAGAAVEDDRVRLRRPLVEVGDPQLAALEEVLDVGAGLLEGQQPRVSAALPEQRPADLDQGAGLGADREHALKPL